MPSNVVELLPVPLTDRKRVERFLRVPWHIYREYHQSPNWVPPILLNQRRFLHLRKNPFFEHAECSFWIAHVGGRDVGRIAAVDDADWVRFNGQRIGYFGFFESPDDPAVARTLLDAAFDFLRQRGIVEVIGPLSLSTNHQTGLLVDGFDSDPCIEMPYNPPFYDRLLKEYGLEKRKELWQWRIDIAKPILPRIVNLANRIRARNRISVRRMERRNWDAEVESLLEVYNDAWSELWGFVPLRAKEMRYLAANLKLVLRPELALMAEVDGQPVAICITIMDINPILKRLNGRLFPTGLIRFLWDFKIRSKVSSGRLIIAGIKRGYRRWGIGPVLYVESYKAAVGLGWTHIDIGWTLEDNDDANRVLLALGGKKIKTFRVYGRQF